MSTARCHPSTTRRARLAVVGLVALLLGLAALPAAGPPAAAAVAQRLTAGFSSSFNLHHNGWTVLNGSWDHPEGKTIRTRGLASQWSALVRKSAFGDLTFEARMKRAGCGSCANGLVVRSRPNAESDYEFTPGLFFEYANNGFFSVWRMKPDGTPQVVKSWTNSWAIVREGWNVLKVEAEGSTFRFYVNDSKVWEGTIAAPSAGRVGIAMYRDGTSTGNNFRVDWARLTLAPTPVPGFGLGVPTGAAVLGGDVDRSPGA